ncbi:glycosyltransferase family 2 protein [Paenibacillus kobensis]|uniref:glycosyltransferase family 2 protein n=1 Tax=Paenibacillus kobensis TaxID=59841 RepID=UPI000FD7A138|nr:glycosyltransferase [Paenibacillus kobensis]
MYKFTVVIPTFQRTELLANTLAYLNKQDRYTDDLEVIVVDDGSNDGGRTRDMVSQFQARYDLKYIYLERIPDASASRTRNAGLDIARGDIVVFMDDDILVRENFLTEHARYHDQYDSLLTLGHRRNLNEAITNRINGQTFTRQELTEESFPETRMHILQLQSFNLNSCKDAWIHAYSFTMSVKRKNLQRNGICFDEAYQLWGSEDVDFGYQLYVNGMKVVLNPEIEVYHQYHGEYHTHPTGLDDSKLRELKINDQIFEEKRGFSYVKRAHKVRVESVRNNPFFEPMPPTKLYVLRDAAQEQELRTSLLHDMEKDRHKFLVVYDESGLSNIDLWIQITKQSPSCKLLYYPADNPVAEVVRPLMNKDAVEIVVL